jgi:proteasome accessory factor A
MVISAFESGFLDHAPEIEDPVRTFKKISTDTQECEWKLKLKSGESTDAVSILRFYHERIEAMYEEMGEEKEDQKWTEIGRKCLKEVIEDLEARQLEKYVDGIDWVTKLALLVNYEPKNAAEGISICNQYALVDESALYGIQDGEDSLKGSCLYNPKESQAFAKRALPEVDWSSLSDRVKYALHNAPEQTRDFFKVEMLRRYGSHVRSVSWSTMVLDEAKIMLDEPFMLNKEEIGTKMVEGKQIEDVLSAAKELYPDKVIF